MANWVQNFQIKEFKDIENNSAEYFLVISKILEKPKKILHKILLHYEYNKKKFLYLKRFSIKLVLRKCY